MTKRRKQRRRSIRLPHFDYASPGAYPITITTRDHKCLFGQCFSGKVALNGAGQLIENIWRELPVRFPFVELDEFVIMPNHIHGILCLFGRGEPCVRPQRHGKPDLFTTGDHKDRPYDYSDLKENPDGTTVGSIGRIIQAFKSLATNEYARGVKDSGWQPFPDKLWQRNYYEHVIRNDDELARVRQYIVDNPLQWELNRENPEAKTVETKDPWAI